MLKLPKLNIKLPSPFSRSLRARFNNVHSRTRNTYKSTYNTLSENNPIKKLDKKSLVILTYLSTFALLGMILAIFGAVLVFAYFSRELPNPNQLLVRGQDLSSKIFDRNGKLIYEVFTSKNRDLVKFENVSTHLVNATLATEDAYFYTHNGYSIMGMTRAIKNMVRGESLQSGSTLTQQVVKNALLTQDQTYSRKIKELILALQIEAKYSKNEIIQMYLNETPYGGQNYGVLTSARAYFNKDPKDLTLAESAYLAGLPQRPSYYSQFGSSPEAGLERKNYVLYLMKEFGWTGEDGKRYYISNDEYESAKSEELKFQSPDVPFNAPHFVFYVKQLIADQFGEESLDQGLQITTSLDLDMQQKAQEIVFEQVEAARRLNVGNAGMVVVDPKTGQILTMVGSKGYNLESEPEGCISGITGENSCTFEPALNVTLAKRQPGSTIKPITYATMLSQGYTASFPFIDVETKFPGSSPDKPYIPENYDGTFRGPVSLRKSLGNSLNIPAVKALRIAGVDSMIDLAESMGITTLKDRQRYGLALTLGGGETKLAEMTGAFASFAAKGLHRESVAILEVKDASGNLLYKWSDLGGKRVLGEEVAFLISDILSDDGARSDSFGPGSLLNITGHQVAVKTGTTDDKRDNYAIGYTPSVAVGVWVGNNNNDAMNPVLSSGITGATPIWHDFMTYYLKDKPNEKFEAPSNVKKMNVDTLTGMLPYDDRSTRSEWFVVGTEPTAVSPWYSKLEICKKDGKLASDACRDADETEVNTYIKITSERSEWQVYVDEWVRDVHGDDEEYFPPTSVSKLEFDDDGDVSNDNAVYVDFTSYKDGDTVPLDFRLGVEPSASNDIKEVKIYLDGERVTTDKSYPYGYNFSFTSAQSGTHEFKAVAVDKNGNEGSASIKLKVEFEE